MWADLNNVCSASRYLGALKSDLKNQFKEQSYSHGLEAVSVTTMDHKVVHLCTRKGAHALGFENYL